MTKIEPNQWRRRASFLVLAGLFCAGVWLTHPAAAEQTATVATEQLYVRRGPGSEFPPFATLGRGDRVEVHEVRGEWARIVTGSGLTGYVRSDFLSLPKEKDKATATAVLSETPRTSSAAGVATMTRTPRSSRTPTATRKPKLTATPSPERPTRTPRLTATARVTATHSPEPTPSDVPPSPTMETMLPVTGTPATTVVPTIGSAAGGAPIVATDTAMLERLRVEVARLTLAVEELRRRMDSQPSLEGPLPVSDGSRQSSPSGWSMAFAFGMIGALTGWILGASVGRRQERSQRSRIRF